MESRGERTEIFGVLFDDVLPDEAAARAAELTSHGPYRYSAGTNADLLRMARRDAGYREAINGAALSLADGCGVICAARILGKTLRRRLPCIDLLEALLPKLRGTRVYILGGKPGTAERAAGRLREKYPEMRIVGVHHGYFSDPEAMAREVAQARPELLLVCLGSPKQELWMHQYGALTGANLAFGCGGWIDIAAGDLRRAPESWQKRNLEWAWRFLQEPWRVGRVLGALAVPLIALYERVRGK